MRKLLAMIALVSPLAAAPLAFGADNPDATFYKKAAESGIFEVDAGNQAQQKASMQPVITPGEAVFSVIESTERQLGTPSPSAASRTAWGTISNISSVVRVMVGIIMIPSATPPASASRAESTLGIMPAAITPSCFNC